MAFSGYLYRLGFVYFLAFLILFFSGFYITNFEASSFSSILRFFLAVGVLLLFLIAGVSGFLDKFRLKGYATAKNKYLYMGLTLFFCYILIASVFLSEWSVFRRSIVVLFFLIIVGFYTFYLRFNYEYFINLLGVLGFIVGSLYLYNYLMINDFSFSGYRSNPVKSTGLSWLANYDNTITAALHLSVLCIAIVWSFFNAKNKVVSVFYYVAFFILLLAIVLTFARTAWVAVFTGLLIFFIYELKRNRLKALSLYSVLFFLGNL